MNLRLQFVMMMTVCLLAVSAAKTKKKSTTSSESRAKQKSKTSPKAIIAIEIVDPSNGKSSRNSKRTIDSSLGYGYQSFLGATHQQPKYEVYKYSQHDIPAYQPSGASHSHVYQTNSGPVEYDVQKSISYDLPTQKYTEIRRPAYHNYQPGTLYSTVNQQGQLGGLSSHAPQNSYNHGASPVPVIILRVYPNQLNDATNAIYPKLPQSHPLAHNLNSINLQSLLSSYYQGMVQQAPKYVYQAPTYIPEPQPQYQQQNYQQYEAPQNYQAQYQQQPEPQYQEEEQQYQDQYGSQEEDANSLLTHENYPSNSHTRVIFRDPEGNVKTTQTQAPPPVETKTIKIHVPPGISAVQVQTPDMHYSYANQITDDQQNENYQYYVQQPASEENQQAQAPQAEEQEHAQQAVNQQQYEYRAEETTKAPFNYHAHQYQKRRTRSKKSNDGATAVKQA